MMRYKKFESIPGMLGSNTMIHDTETGQWFVEPQEASSSHEQGYLDWISEGNIPEIINN